MAKPSIPASAEGIADTLARNTLRASIGSSRTTGIALVLAGLAGSWLIVHLAGGANSMVPHWYYIPILFAAARFGAYAALVVALCAGVIAGPLTYENVAAGTTQELSRWLTRTAFFVGIGQLMAWLGGPSLRPFTEEVSRLRQEYEIRRGLAQREFFLRYQPIYCLNTRQCVGFEALIRWQHPSRGELAPGAFIDIAEQSPLIHDLTDFVINEACRQSAAWNALATSLNKPALHIAINLSARDLEQTDLTRKILDALKRYNLSAERLHVELTESVLALSGAAFQLRKLRQAGIKLHIDDFGTGYSSLSYLSKLSMDYIKVDRSLIDDICSNAHSRTLADCIVVFAKKFELQTVAEGIENESQLAMARSKGFDLAQGFYLSRPLLAEAVPKVILTQKIPASSDQDRANFRTSPPTR